MVLAVGAEVWLGSFAVLISAVTGGYAVVKGQRTEADAKREAAKAALQASQMASRAADREEVQQALNAQAESLERAWGRAAVLEARVASLEAQAAALAEQAATLADQAAVLADQAVAAAEREEDCNRRLHVAEARIAELGG